MSNGGKTASQGQRRPNSLGDLVRKSLGKTRDAKAAEQRLRTTYLKNEYRDVFPAEMVVPKRRTVGPIGSRKRDFDFVIDKESICFIRNLWFVDRLLLRPSRVVKFLTARCDERREMLQRRFDELKELADDFAYRRETAGRVFQKLQHFQPTKTDLLSASLKGAIATQPEFESPRPLSSTGIAEFIREVEQRASYQAGNPDDACEKALYFLALGRPDIGETIAKEVLAENPNHAVALYTNAVFLLDASERHQKQAFIHDVMHPHELIPVEAEEQWHADRHTEESELAWEKASRAFLLMLKARQNWPTKFPIKRYELAPENWRHRVEEWLFAQATARIGGNPSTLNLPSKAEAENALTVLAEIVTETWTNDGKWMFRQFGADFLRRFIIVAAHARPDVARDCLSQLEAALDHRKLDETELIWREQGIVLPVSQEPTLAETLLPAVTNSCFCRAVFTAKPGGEGIALLRQIIRLGLSDERDRRAVIRSLVMRAAVLHITQAGDLDQAVALCREMADRSDWPATETGEKLLACWRYAVVLLLFDSSRAAFEMNDIPTAAKQSCLALELATDSLMAIADEKPLLKIVEEDDYGETETVGDFLCRQPNLITDTSPLDFFPPATPSTLGQLGHKPCWDDFMQWYEAEYRGGRSVLLAYGFWLAQRHGQTEMLLPKCDAFAARLDALTPK